MQTSSTSPLTFRDPSLLPPEVFHHILTYVEACIPSLDPVIAAAQREAKQETLLACARVSRRWKASALPVLWRDPHVGQSKLLVDKVILGSRLSAVHAESKGKSGLSTVGLEENGGRHEEPNGQSAPAEPWLGLFVQRLDLRDIHLVEPADTSLLRILADTFPNLRTLRLKVGRFCESTLNYIFTKCPRIHTFSLKGSAFQGMERPRDILSLVDDDMVVDGGGRSVRERKQRTWTMKTAAAVAEGVKRLKALDLYNVIYEDGSAFYSLIESSVGPNLQFINLGRTWVADKIVTSIASKCPNLRGVWLEENIGLSDAAIAVLAAKCPNLETVKLRNCVGLTDVSVRELALKCRNLKALGISYSRCTDASLYALAEYSTNLHTLFMNDLPLEDEDSVLAFLTRRGRKLKTLGMCQCEVVSDRSIRMISEMCPNLEELDIQQCGDSSGSGEPIREESLERVIGRCRKLKTLVVHEVDGLSQEYVEGLGRRICTQQFWLEPPGF
ncbi:hypothetical protein HK097_007404 [Rhizophlyctis rosea]|uniref:F-box domain-containing protein n=1 Tax=Rhizophlyctis rosea TaxID=64517 RepID=A0AAD5SQG4_9FUNG|nr:hypothetical protein HK097_007404 [Rhizophlyctis rosea]